jgi:hypothetical protein
MERLRVARSALRAMVVSVVVAAFGLLGLVSASASAPAGVGSRAPSVSHVARAPSHALPRVQYSSVRVNGLRLRRYPGGVVRGLLYRGDRLQVVGWSGPWMHVRLTERSGGGSRAGATGWVAKSHLVGPACRSYRSWPCNAWR